MPSSPPQHFVCPITLEVMDHPMAAPDGRRFERSAIMEWLYFGTGTCPLTRRPLHPQQLREDLKLKEEIQAWRSEHDVSKHDEKDEPQNPDAMPSRLLDLRNRVLLQVEANRCLERARRRLSAEKRDAQSLMQLPEPVETQD